MITQDLDKITNLTSRETVFNLYAKETNSKQSSPFHARPVIGRTNSSSGVSSELNDETIDDDIYESINEDTYLQTSELGQASAIPLENSSVTQNATQSVTENVTPSMMKPVPQLVTQPVIEAITEPDPAQSDEYESTTNVITEPDLENANLTQIMEKPVAQPIIQPITQPITQANTELNDTFSNPL